MINNTWNCSNICVCIPKCNAGSHCTESNQNSYEVPFPCRNLQNTLLMYERCTLDKLSSTFLENTWHEETVQNFSRSIPFVELQLLHLNVPTGYWLLTPEDPAFRCSESTVLHHHRFATPEFLVQRGLLGNDKKCSIFYHLLLVSKILRTDPNLLHLDLVPGAIKYFSVMVITGKHCSGYVNNTLMINVASTA